MVLLTRPSSKHFCKSQIPQLLFLKLLSYLCFADRAARGRDARCGRRHRGRPRGRHRPGRAQRARVQ